MILDLLTVATVLALVAAVAFIAVYSRLPWWRSLLGRMLMAGGLAVTLLTMVGTVRRIDDRVESVDLSDALNISSAVAYLIIAGVWAYKTWVITHRDDDTSE